MTQIQQAATEVIVTLVVAIVYYGLAWKQCGDCDHKKLGWIVVTALGAVTGVFIFIGCFEVMKVYILNGVWSAVAGIMITLTSTTEIMKEFRSLFASKEVAPVENPRNDNSTTSHE